MWSRWVARHRTSETSQPHAVQRESWKNIVIEIRALDLRFRHGIQALETHLLLPEDLDISEADLRAMPKSSRLSLVSLALISRILREKALKLGKGISVC